jgi:hypothetical protein
MVSRNTYRTEFAAASWVGNCACCSILTGADIDLADSRFAQQSMKDARRSAMLSDGGNDFLGKQHVREQ